MFLLAYLSTIDTSIVMVILALSSAIRFEPPITSYTRESNYSIDMNLTQYSCQSLTSGKLASFQVRRPPLRQATLVKLYVFSSSTATRPTHMND